MKIQTKKCHICNKVNKVLDNEQSVKAAILKYIVSKEVQNKLQNMRNQVKKSR